MRKAFKIFSTVVIFGGLLAAVYLVGQRVGFWGKAGGVNANLVIDLTSSYPDSHFAWKNLAQGGEEKTNMLASVVDKTASLHPKYIRIDHIYDFYDVISKNGGSLNFNWTKLDDVISTIGRMGAKPYLSMTWDVPVDMTEWELIVERTIEHVSGTLGIDNVYYEVWNEPDLFGGFKTYGNNSYFTLYAHASVGASRASGVKSYKLGGPATTALYQTWARDFTKFVLDNKLRLDFYSWHRYSMDLDTFESDVISAKAFLIESGMPESTEFVISEIGPDSNNNPVYDTGFGAIHLLATSATMEDYVDKLFAFEVKDGPKNKWGILTADGTAKPRYNALAFLNNMTGNRVPVVGLGSWVKAFAKYENKKVKIFVVNYDPVGTHSEAVPMTFTNLPTKDFEFKRALNWGEGQTKDITVATTEATWSTLEYMSPNTAAIFEFILK